MIKGVMAVLGCLFFLGTVWAGESYEASPGLIRPGGLVLFYNAQGPLSYESLSRRELPPQSIDAGTVSGQSCQYGLTIPLGSPASRASSVSGATGNGGYDNAILSIKRNRPEILGVYDVKVDLHYMSILGIFSKLCTEISARGFR